MSVWLTIPSARPPAEAEPILALWRMQGYKIALAVDGRSEAEGKLKMADIIIGSPDGYRGYAKSVNALVELVMRAHPDAEWFVAGGDDTEPDMALTAEEIAAQCRDHFGPPSAMSASPQDTFGVMQPTGDRFDGGSIDRICGSPWMGREFCRRIYGGKGPLWPEFAHMFVDEHLQNIALKLGILWQRPDLIHLHRHFARASAHLSSGAVGFSEGGKVLYGGDRRPRPAFLDKWNSKSHWDESKAIFMRLKAGGFAEAGDLLPELTEMPRRSCSI